MYKLSLLYTPMYTILTLLGFESTHFVGTVISKPLQYDMHILTSSKF